MPQFLEINASLDRQLRHLLMVVAQSVPFKSVMKKEEEAVS